jgi:hypothetical protein
VSDKPLYEIEKAVPDPDPDEVPIRDRRLVTNPYDLVVQALIDQIANKTIFLRPLSERPSFQRRYVWPNILASRLVESVLLNVPIPPCYLSQNDDFELDVIDGQQRLYSIYRFCDNQFALSGLEVLKELNGSRFHQLQSREQRKIKTHTIRCVLISNESHPEIKFDVFERLNTNTVPLNAQELRNCIYRGTLNDLLKEAVAYPPWLAILRKKAPDKRMRDEELALRFFAFATGGLQSYRTPQKHWLNDAAKNGRKYSEVRISELSDLWKRAIDNSLIWFEPEKCFRRAGSSRAINRALFDLFMASASKISSTKARQAKKNVVKGYAELLQNPEFKDLISRSVDHKKRTLRRFELWRAKIDTVLG